MGTLTSPEPLTPHHIVAEFRCTEPALETWLARRALANQVSGASRTFVVCADERVVAYYALAAGSVTLGAAPAKVRRNMPDPIPVIVLGRLAVHQAYAGLGIGAGLLKDAVLRSLGVAKEVGARALPCHAISVSAKRFYLRHGFVESPVEPLTLFLSLTGL